jgi:ATP-binding cassette, subfamily B, multidrug efflux pump
MMALGWVTNLIQRGRASLDRLDGIFSTQPELVEPRKRPAHRTFEHSLSADQVSFAYEADRGEVLRQNHPLG